jgi:hypothetical protein
MSSKKALNLIAASVLLVGLCGALLLYVQAQKESDEADFYAFEHSKAYAHNMRVYGGVMAVLADDLRRWFRDTWRGTTRAYIVVGITILMSGCLFYSARRFPAHPKRNA